MKIELNFNYDANRTYAEFYKGYGTIIKAINSNGDTLEIFEEGILSAWLPNEDNDDFDSLYKGENASERMKELKWTDENIQQLNYIGKLQNSNWFSYIVNNIDSDAVLDSTDECLEILTSFIKNESI